MTQLETSRTKETADVCYLFEGDADVFTLAGLDNDLEWIDLRPNPTVGRERSFLDDYELDSTPLSLGASPTGFLHNTSDRSDFSQCNDPGVTLHQPVLDLGPDEEEEEMNGEEMVLDF